MKAKSKLRFGHWMVFLAIALSWASLLYRLFFMHPKFATSFAFDMRPEVILSAPFWAYITYTFKKEGTHILWKQSGLLTIWSLIGSVLLTRENQWPIFAVLTAILFFATINLVIFLDRGDTVNPHLLE